MVAEGLEDLSGYATFRSDLITDLAGSIDQEERGWLLRRRRKGERN
jgi:hypothetical protein